MSKRSSRSQKSNDVFVQQYAYVEDYSLYINNRRDDKKFEGEQRGFVEIDLGNGTSFEIKN
ncbi:MAG: hypothetical protein WC942_01100 [Clostridia bacterium]|jgi:hypothetical protein